MALHRRRFAYLLAGILGAFVAACGGDDTGSGVIVLPPDAPTVLVTNPPVAIRLGETVTFPVQVTAPRGIRQNSFLQVTIREPRNTRPTEFINPEAFGCQPGDTTCGISNFAFRVGANADTGNYQLTFVGFDQTGQSSAPVTIFISAFN